MCSHQAAQWPLTDPTSSAGTTSERALALLETLCQVVPFDGAWPAPADPPGHGHRSSAGVDPADPTPDFLSCPLMARDSGSTGTAIDAIRSLLTAARLVRGATAGVVLRVDGGCEPLPGLENDALLAPRSPVLAAARDRIADRHVCSSFLWPVGGTHAPGGHVRVTVVAAPEDVPPPLTAVAVLSPATDLHGLTPRELEVLGLLVEGCSNQEIARVLVVAPRTAATHLEHVLGKLAAPTRTHAAVRAERDGLYVPAPPAAVRSCARLSPPSEEVL